MFVFFAIVIAILAINYSNNLTYKLAEEEQKKVEIVANALKTASNYSNSDQLDLAFQIISSNATIPLIITDNFGTILSETNHEGLGVSETKDSIILRKKILEYEKMGNKIEVKVNDSTAQYVYYGASALREKLKMYPYLVLGVFFIFSILLLYFLNYSNKLLYDKIWVGMSKETAHQLGTPLSSMLAWLQLLKENKEEVEMIVPEMENDLARLQLISDRFSKIGSVPVLEYQALLPIIKGSVVYIKQRASEQVGIQFNYSVPENLSLELNKPLFEWVIENLLRNALDAMQGKGHIRISLYESEQQVIIDVEDSGKGIAKGNWKKVFYPGFSTKKRGWGLGLSLSKRIIKEYHKGDIFVKQSEIDLGTTFRIILNKI